MSRSILVVFNKESYEVLGALRTMFRHRTCLDHIGASPEEVIGHCEGRLVYADNVTFRVSFTDSNDISSCGYSSDWTGPAKSSTWGNPRVTASDIIDFTKALSHKQMDLWHELMARARQTASTRSKVPSCAFHRKPLPLP